MPTPINVQQLRSCLTGYDTELAGYLIQGFSTGFDLCNTSYSINDSVKNQISANQLPDIVDKKINKEIHLGRIKGPFDTPPLNNLVISPLGIRPKKVAGEYRVIHNLSHPYNGGSVNAGIPREAASVQYSDLSVAIQHILHFGQYTFLAKSDIQSAFRIIPIKPDNYHLLGFTWKGKFYYDCCLPMGASSSCAIFEKFSTSLEWMISQQLKTVKVVHVLDDFLFIGPSYQSCLHALKLFKSLCVQLGVPLAPDKTVGPTMILPFLGITLNTETMSAALPPDKVTKFTELIDNFLAVKAVTLKQLQSLNGMLNFACQIILPARAFSRRLYDLSIGLNKPYYRVKMNRQVKADLKVWKAFLANYNYRTFFLEKIWLNSTQLSLYTDAASTVGFGAKFGKHWFADIWPSTCSHYHITILELYPIVLALLIWTSHLANKCLHIYTDNQAVSYILNNFTSKEPTIMNLIRKLVLHCMTNNILIKASYYPGHLNKTADMLSRLQVQQAKEIDLELEETPTGIPPHLQLDRLLTD